MLLSALWEIASDTAGISRQDVMITARRLRDGDNAPTDRCFMSLCVCVCGARQLVSGVGDCSLFRFQALRRTKLSRLVFIDLADALGGPD